MFNPPPAHGIPDSPGTGYAIGDYLAHIVTLDPKSGVSIGDFWINATQAQKLATPPPSADIAPIAPLPVGAAKDTSVLAGNALLNNILMALAPLATNADVAAGLAAVVAKNETIRALLAGTLAVQDAAVETGIGAPGDAAVQTSGASGSAIAQLKGLLARVLVSQAGPGGSATVAHAVQGTTGGVPVVVTPNASTIVADTSGTLAAGGAATPVAASLTRQFIEITNTGPNPLAYRWGAAASALLGHILGAGQSVRYDAKVPTAALSVFSTAGTSFFVTTG